MSGLGSMGILYCESNKVAGSYVTSTPMTRRGSSQRTTALLGLVPAVFIGAFFLLPLAVIFRETLTLSRSTVTTLTGPSVRSVVWFTTWQAAVSTALTLVIGVPIAWALARFRFPGRQLVRAAVTVPFVLPTVVVASTFTRIGSFEIGTSVWAILWAHVFFNVAVVVRSLSGYWARLDPEIEEQARVLGASQVNVFRRITLPRLQPVLLSAAAIVFLFTFSSFGVVLLLGGGRRATIETEVWRYATQRTEFDVAAVLALLQLLVVGLMLWVAGRAGRKQRHVDGVTIDHAVAPASWRHRTQLGACLALALVVIGVPLVSLVGRSLRSGNAWSTANYLRLFDDPGPSSPLADPIWEIVANSVWFAVLASVLAAGSGLLAAIVLHRVRGRIAVVLDGLVLLPLGASAVMLGLGLLLTFDTDPFDWRASWFLIPVAHALVGFPFVVRSVLPMIRNIEPGLREAAAVLGASPRQVWRSVDEPIVRRAFGVGAGFAFAVSVGEFGATSFLARPQRLTMPTAIFRLLGRPGTVTYGQAMALSVVLMLVTATAMLLIERGRGGAVGDF